MGPSVRDAFIALSSHRYLRDFAFRNIYCRNAGSCCLHVGVHSGSAQLYWSTQLRAYSLNIYLIELSIIAVEVLSF
jgi:hypothetical protein